MRARNFAILAVAAAALGSSIPAFASPPGWAPAHGHRQQFHGPHMYNVGFAPAYGYRAAPMAVYRAPVAVYRAPVAVYRAPVRYSPPPSAYRVYPDRAAGGAFAGAVAGAIIGGSLATGEQRFPAVAIGTVLGAVIGHEIASGY